MPDRPIATSGAVADVLVDTDIFVDHLRGAAELKPGRHRIHYSVITRAELFAGSTGTDLVSRLLAPFREIAVDPYVLFGVSDGGAHTKFLTAGRYPTETLMKVVRDEQMISLEEAQRSKVGEQLERLFAEGTSGDRRLSQPLQRGLP